MAYPEGRDEYCAYERDTDYEVEEALIVPYRDVHVIDLEAFADEVEAKENEEELAEEEDRAEYERLKKKFG